MNSSKGTGIVNIHGKDYKTVAKRVDEFRKKYETKMSIITSLVSIDEKTVVMRAEILDENGRAIATGFAEEDRQASQINRTSALENCETSAIGRALANFGLAGGEYASADELTNALKQQQASLNQEQPKKQTSRLDFDSIREHLDMLDDLESVNAYYEELKKIHQSPAQEKYINGMFNKKKAQIAKD